MKSKQIRDLTFYLHRYLGLIVGLVVIIIGFTGSLLVFEKEINQFLISQQFGQVIPQEQRLTLESILETVKTAYTSRSRFSTDRRQISLKTHRNFTKSRCRSPKCYHHIYPPAASTRRSSQGWEKIAARNNRVWQ